MTASLFVSIIVPTYHDWTRLSLCVKALECQTYPKGYYEVILVNNDPADPAPDNYALPENFILISEGRPGSYAARNAGLAIAKGEVIGFTDSDCIPNQDWIENAIKMFSNGDVDRIAGRIELFYQNSTKRTWVELYESAYSFKQQWAVEVLKGSVTANLFTKKELFTKVGVFDATKKSGEDIGWNRRANSFGYNLIYGDSVCIKHPARATIKEFKNQKLREFGGKKEFKLKTVKGLIKNALYPPFLFYSIVVDRSLLLQKEKQLSAVEKAKVVSINVYLYFILLLEFFRLMFGGERIR